MGYRLAVTDAAAVFILCHVRNVGAGPTQTGITNETDRSAGLLRFACSPIGVPDTSYRTHRIVEYPGFSGVTRRRAAVGIRVVPAV